MCICPWKNPLSTRAENGEKYEAAEVFPLAFLSQALQPHPQLRAQQSQLCATQGHLKLRQVCSDEVLDSSARGAQSWGRRAAEGREVLVLPLAPPLHGECQSSVDCPPFE